MEEILSQGSLGTPLAPLDTYIRLDIASTLLDIEGQQRRK
jgi:hypothetical protein